MKAERGNEDFFSYAFCKFHIFHEYFASLLFSKDPRVIMDFCKLFIIEHPNHASLFQQTSPFLLSGILTMLKISDVTYQSIYFIYEKTALFLFFPTNRTLLIILCESGTDIQKMASISKFVQSRVAHHFTSTFPYFARVMCYSNISGNGTMVSIFPVGGFFLRQCCFLHPLEVYYRGYILVYRSIGGIKFADFEVDCPLGNNEKGPHCVLVLISDVCHGK